MLGVKVVQMGGRKVTLPTRNITVEPVPEFACCLVSTSALLYLSLGVIRGCNVHMVSYVSVHGGDKGKAFFLKKRKVNNTFETCHKITI